MSELYTFVQALLSSAIGSGREQILTSDIEYAMFVIDKEREKNQDAMDEAIGDGQR